MSSAPVHFLNSAPDPPNSLVLHAFKARTRLCPPSASPRCLRWSCSQRALPSAAPAGGFPWLQAHGCPRCQLTKSEPLSLLQTWGIWRVLPWSHVPLPLSPAPCPHPLARTCGLRDALLPHLPIKAWWSSRPAPGHLLREATRLSRLGFLSHCTGTSPFVGR